MKHLGLLAGLVICLAVATSASATVIESFDFEAPDWSTGAVSGQNGWTGTGTIMVGQYLYKAGTGVKHVTGYGTSWWTESGIRHNNGFPYADAVASRGVGLGGVATTVADVTIEQDQIDKGTGTTDLATFTIDWNDESWTYDFENGNTEITNGGGSVRLIASLRADGTTRLRFRHTYAILTGLTIDSFGTWAKTAGTYTLKTVMDKGSCDMYVNDVLTSTSTWDNETRPVDFNALLDKQIFTAGLVTASPILAGPEWDNIVVSQVPEPATMLLLGSGLLLGGFAYRKRG